MTVQSVPLIFLYLCHVTVFKKVACPHSSFTNFLGFSTKFFTFDQLLLLLITFFEWLDHQSLNQNNDPKGVKGSDISVILNATEWQSPCLSPFILDSNPVPGIQ